MATRNGGPACPKVDRLEELMDWLTYQKKPEGDIQRVRTDGQAEPIERELNNNLQECIEALDYLHTSLSNRKSYHQKRQAEQKLFMETAKNLLSPDELNAIKKQAEREING
jgi:hypothetical protein